MALPAGLTTFTLTLGPYTDATGSDMTGIVGKLVPIHPETFRPLRLVHAQTGEAVLPKPIAVAVGTPVGPLPHTDNPVLVYIDSDGATKYGFLYDIAWDVPQNQPSPGNKRFAAPAAAGSSIDFDLLSTSPAVPGVVVPVVGGVGGGGAVASVNGKVGVVVLSAADVGAQPAGSSNVVVAGSNLGTPRPATTGPVVWFATAEPVNADDTQDVTVYVAEDGTLVSGSGGVDAEAVRDLIGSTLVAGTNMAKVVDDAGDTVTVSTTATVNATDAQLRDRATHTGTQAATTITGLATVATSGAYSDLAGRPVLATVATTGSYSDLSGVPDTGPPMTFDPRWASTTVAALPANRAYYARTVNGGTINGVQIDVGVQSGNICIGVYRTTGAGPAARPGTRVATSGSVLCPAVGAQTVNFTAPITVLPGDWLAIVSDNATATFRRVLNSGLQSAALFCQQDSAFPLPATTTAPGASGNTVMMVGA